MDLFSIDLASILPGSLMDDTSMQAAATAAQTQLIAVSNLMGNVAIWSRLDSITEPLLSTLAWQLHVDDFEGWALAKTDDQKRKLIRESLIIHRFKGTRWSLERIFTLLDMEGKVFEWFEYGGDPYKFMIDLTVTRGLDETFSDDVLALVDALKNVRSHLDRLRIIPTQSGATRTASVAWSATAITVRPPIATEVSASGGPRVGVGCWATSTVTLYPSEA